MNESFTDEDLFAAALALPATERTRYLARACSDNAVLFNRLSALLDAFGDAAGFVNDSAKSESGRIGPYRLLQELGEGGCGVAYLSEQTAPVKRHVALKIIKPGMDTKAVIARFEAERQVLALMDHPNVAKVFDAGATGEGRPYFVMELVRGIKITEYCEQSRLTVSERLSLFIQVCQAIQHAHQKGIIHRDIKPSNVLVTMHDGSPVAKVIDFGIAKATQGRLTEHTLHTAVDQLVGTPAYISPEQTAPSQAGVDTRSDIYSLGILLYELLTGRTPVDASELAQTSIDRLRERIRSEEPVRPSQRLSRAPSKLMKQVEGDLDWIVMRCLEKEPARRYQSVTDLILDLDRHLRHEPVHARPPTLIYSVRKFARRNRIAFVSTLTAGTFVLFIIAFAITMMIQVQRTAAERDRAMQERQRAEKVSNVALKVFGVADPIQNFGRDVSAPLILEQAAESIQQELADQPRPRALLLQAIGRAYIRRGVFNPSIEYLRDAVSILGRIRGAEGELLMATVDLSIGLFAIGDQRAAREMLTESDRLAKRHRLERSAAYAALLLHSGRLALWEGRVSHARMDFERSLRLYREVSSARSIEVGEVLSELSLIANWSDDFSTAERLGRQAVEVLETSTPSTHPTRVRAELVLAEVLTSANQIDEAASILANVLLKRTELYGRNSFPVAETLDFFATIRFSQGRLDEAETLSREAVVIVRMALGEKHSGTAVIETTFGAILSERRKYSDAESTLRGALDTLRETLPHDHQYAAAAEYYLGEVLLGTNRSVEAIPILTASMNRWARSDAPRWRVARSASALGEALYRQGRKAEGARYLSDSFRDLSADPKAEAAATKKAQERVARYLQKQPTQQPAQHPHQPAQRPNTAPQMAAENHL